ncbi:MAG: 3-phosphoshikimate 1-carboxyvinyltransferase [Lachnospiraceae bacterium]|nr:3-phosphoshikimate 1-carboxyvinyltransferase [Lachnospiraceae bacterium]
MNLSIAYEQLTDNCIEAISSKSAVHRLLIAAGLSANPTEVTTNILSDDMEATIDVLTALGADIEIVKEGKTTRILVKSGVKKGSIVSLNCRESGSTARFILPLAAYLCEEATLTGSGRLPERPFEALNEALRSHGTVIDSDFLPITVKNSLKSGIYTIPGNISSQYITGLMFVLPLLEGDSEILVEGKLESKGYVDLTRQVLSKFGIVIEDTDNGFHIPGGQIYNGPSVIKSEGDWSNTAYVLGIGALNKSGSFTVTGVDFDSVQSDMEIVNVLSQFGLSVICDKDKGCVEVSGSLKHGVDVDGSGIPDIIPLMAVIAFFVNDKSIFRNVERLRIKESDRIEAVENMARIVGAGVETVKHDGHEDMIVTGGDFKDLKSDNPVFDGYNDHRVVMASAVCSMRSKTPITIEGAQAVRKSYPGFFEELTRLGFKIQVV